MYASCFITSKFSDDKQQKSVTWLVVALTDFLKTAVTVRLKGLLLRCMIFAALADLFVLQVGGGGVLDLDSPCLCSRFVQISDQLYLLHLSLVLVVHWNKMKCHLKRLDCCCFSSCLFACCLWLNLLFARSTGGDRDPRRWGKRETILNATQSPPERYLH